jgi:hypothetical protein
MSLTKIKSLKMFLHERWADHAPGAARRRHAAAKALSGSEGLSLMITTPDVVD